MNNKRYYNIYQNLEHINFSNIQILLEDVALIRDNDNGKMYARCIYKNLGEKKIKAIAVKIACYSKNGKKENVVEYNYLDLMAGKNKSFGQQAPIEITNINTNRIDVIIDKVMYEDGEIAFFDGNVTIEKKMNFDMEADEESEDNILKPKIGVKAKKRSKIKLIVISISLILVCAFIALGVMFVTKNKDYNKAINDIVLLLNKHDVNEDKYNVYFEFEEVVNYNKVLANANDEEDTFIDEQIEWLKTKFGDDYKISVDVLSSKEINETELSKYNEDYENTLKWYKESKQMTMLQFSSQHNNKLLSDSEYESLKTRYDEVILAYSNINITKGYEVDLLFKVKGNEEAEAKFEKLIILEINGKWYIKQYDFEQFIELFISKISKEIFIN